ncbi:unnamed protein product [Albugo candida]|uniref:Uncharacterized protein n=1 Tax=Albugo candida TaxID=65357 RepID=A0A024FSU8_9STRA|nr:unnamed protein product [Albugo candida]|eukprot:CCI10093.1 unnamed protein product [Albugo candida]
MKLSIALQVLVHFWQGRPSHTYEIQMTVPYGLFSYADLHQCIQPFVPYANFTYDLRKIDAVRKPAAISLEMVADISDDIPFEVIRKYCNTFASIQQNKKRDRDIQPEEFAAKKSSPSDKRNHATNQPQVVGAAYKGELSKQNHRLKQFLLFGAIVTTQTDDAPRKVLFHSDTSDKVPENSEIKGYDAFGGEKNVNRNHQSKKPRTSPTITQAGRTESCLVLQLGLPELWIQDCVRCLAIDKRNERFFVRKTDLGIYQWAFLSSATKTEMLDCQSTCGTIMVGSAIDCPVACLYNMLQEHSAHKGSKDAVPFFYFVFNVAYDQLHMNSCLLCASHNIRPLILHNNEREGYFVGLTGYDYDLSKFKKERLVPHICRKVSKESNRKMDDFLSNFEILGSSQNEAKNLGTKWTTSYQCMHFSTSALARDAYPHPIDVKNIESRGGATIPPCLKCILGESSSDSHKRSWEDLVESIQPTSRSSSLVFFKQELHVQEAAIRCTKKCTWVSGLFESMCTFLRISLLGLGSDAMSREEQMSASIQFSIPPSEQNRNLRDVVRHLSHDSSEDAAWFLQFEQGTDKHKEAFRHLAFCIAAISNSYVVSTASSYILTSRFKYTHLNIFCNLRCDIKVTAYKIIKMGFRSQPSNFASILRSLDFGTQHPNQPLVRNYSGRLQQILATGKH